MKKISFFLFLAGFLTFTANAQNWVNFASSSPKAPEFNLSTSNAQTVTFEVSIPGIYTLDTVVNGTAFTRLMLPGGGAVNPAGHPELPVLTYRVAIPVCDNTEVVYSIDSRKNLPSCWVYPVPEIVLDGNGNPVEQFAFESAAYAQPRLFEPASVISSSGSLRSQRYVEITVIPIEFCPVTRQLSVIDRIEITLTFTNPQGDLRQNVGIFNKVAANTFINYECNGMSAMVNDKAFEKPGFKRGNVKWFTLSDTAQAATIPGDYLIITVSGFFDENDPNSQLKRLAEHRAFYNGFDVTIANVDSILSLPFEYEDNNIPPLYMKEQKMRTFIRRVYEGKNASNPNGDGHLAYVLLVGDNYGNNEGMPTSLDHNATWGGEKYRSDYYYSCIKKTGSVYDNIGSLFIGRLSVEDNTALYNMVEKTIHHETEYGPGNWRKSAGFTYGSDAFTVQYGIHFFNFINSILDTIGWTPHFVSNEPIKDPTLNYLNEGVAYVQYIGGGNITEWEDNLSMAAFSQQLENDYYAPFINTMYKETGWFDNEYCLGEFLTTYSPTKGAVGYIGASRNVPINSWWSSPVNIDNLQFFEAYPYYLFAEKISIAGELMLFSKTVAATSLQTYLRHAFNLFGDPALNIMAEPSDGCRMYVSNQTQILDYEFIVPDDCILYFHPQSKLIIEEKGSLVLGDRVQVIGINNAIDTVIHVKGGEFTIGRGVVFQDLSGGILLENSRNTLGLPFYDETKHYELSGITFNNTPLMHRGTKINVSDCIFNPGSNVKVGIGSFKIARSTFDQTTFLVDHTVYLSGKHNITSATTIEFSRFIGNNSNTAVQLINTRYFEICNNAILGYETGISLTSSGNTIQVLSSNGMLGNHISNCHTGIELFNSVSFFRNNHIYDNVHGVRLFNNSYTIFDNKFQSDQVIRDCDSIELYACANSFPTTLRYNKIFDESMYSKTNPLVYWDVPTPYTGPKQNVNFNYWGDNFDCLEDLYPPNAFLCDSIWSGKSGSPSRYDEMLYFTGLDYFADEDYINAETTFKELIETYPHSHFAKAALHELFALEHFTDYDFATLHNYFASISPENTVIFNTADFLAIRCHIKERNWQPAIDWYENRIENPPSYQDSVFAVIDLGNIHLMMEAEPDGAKSASVYRYRLANIKPHSKQEYETNKADLLATLPQVKSQKPQTPYLTPQTDKKGALGQNIPNPATGITTIDFEIYTEGVVEIAIYNIAGQLVKSLPQGNLTEGNYQTKISLVGMPVGMYHYALFVNGERTDVKKMIVN